MRLRGRRGLVLLGLLIVSGLPGCATTQAKSEPSLYRRLGGRDAIANVVGDFVANVVKDDRINQRFKAFQPAQVEQLKTNLADQICEATGGPCSYLGRDMKTVHQGMRITDAEWDATVEALVKALDKHKVGEKEKSELLALLGPMKPDIVGQ
jgi:hemoglobin